MRSRIRAAAGAVYRRLRSVPPAGEAPPSYTGPLDLVPGVILAYDQRAASAAKLGTALYTILSDRSGTTDQFESNATTGVAPFATMGTFIGSPFTHTGAVVDTLDTITLSDSFADVAVGQVISGTNIPAGTYVISVGSMPIISISQAANGTDAAQVLTFTPNGIPQPWVDQSANGYNTRTESGFTVPITKFSADNIPYFSSLPSQTAFLAAESVGFAAAGARSYSIVFDYVQGTSVTILSHEDIATDAYLEIGTAQNQDDDVYLNMVSADGATSCYWVTPSTMATGRHLVEVWIAANGDATIKIDGVNTNAVIDGDAVVPPESTANVFLRPKVGRCLPYCAYIWQLANANAATSNFIDYYSI